MHRQLLNARQERFILEYLKDQNASAAAVRAGYSEKTKGTHATALMRNPLIIERITFALGDLYADLGISGAKLMRLLARMAYFDPADLLDEDGKALPLHKIDPEVRCLLTVCTTTNAKGETTVSVRPPNRQQAVVRLERYLARFMDLQYKLRRINHLAVPDEEEDDAGAGEPAPAVSPMDQGATFDAPAPGGSVAAQARVAPAAAVQAGASPGSPVSAAAPAVPAAAAPPAASVVTPVAAAVKRGYTLADDPLWPLNHPRKKPVAMQAVPEAAKPGLPGGWLGKDSAR